MFELQTMKGKNVKFDFTFSIQCIYGFISVGSTSQSFFFFLLRPSSQNPIDLQCFDFVFQGQRGFFPSCDSPHFLWQHFVPPVAESLLERDCDLLGQLYYKDCHNLDQWRKGWFAIEKSSLYFCLEMEDAEEDSIYLRRLQELSKNIQHSENVLWD